MSNKKVLVITNMYPSAKHKSFGIFVKNQVDAITRRNVLVDVVAITNPNNGKVNVFTKYLSWLIKTIWILGIKGRSYDVIHAHYVFPSGYLGLLFKKLFKKRLIVTAHGGDIDKMAKRNKRLFQLTKSILQQADHVIAVGNELHHEIVTKFSVKQQNVSILNMGVNREIFKPIDMGAAREQCWLEKDAKIILFVGNLLEQKGLIELIEAARLVHERDTDVQLVIIGAEKDPNFKRFIENKIMDFHLQNMVTILDTKEQPEIAVWMCAADCLVLPAHIEGFGLVALEAMACGTPVIGTNVGGLKTLLAGGAGEIVSAKNSSDLANSISQVLASEEIRSKLIKNGFKKAEENDQEYILNRVMEVYFPTGG
ncbi:glycosyltransferase [Neobacillus sp. OS1-2]|uniref:glycosyltransferase n=1 Tax=Neobacillus sp. OS1-2 TaxID=3070680 RepID=UPI0027DF5562|nr:glycosyltransferase [Neobacillus sp. OS1-2]WML41215.1 glycosyltransferase [Neobacillus sp. OS1-2]